MSDEQKSPETSPCGCNSPKDTGLSNTWKTVIFGLVILAAGAVASHRILTNPSPKSCGVGGGCCPGQMAPSPYQGCCPGETASQTPECCPADTPATEPAAKAMAMPSHPAAAGQSLSCCAGDDSGLGSGCCPMQGSHAGCDAGGCAGEDTAPCPGCAGPTAETP